MLSVFFAICAGFFLAVMDRVENEPSFNKSIFADKDPRWWCKTISWQYVDFLPFTRYRPDAWHLAKSGMILSCGLMAGFSANVVNPVTWGIVLGVIITASFVLFYDYILIKK